MTTSTQDQGSPYCVAIVAMGPSHKEFLSDALKASSRWQVADEIWAINAMAGVIQHDRAIIMDDLPYFAKAARSENASLVGYADWLKQASGPPIFAQSTYEEFPRAVEYPLKDVVRACGGYAYFNSTVAYAVGLAILEGVKHLKLYGCDFTQALSGGDGQGGRACVEFWLAYASFAKGMKVSIANTSSLCDQNSQRQLYGYVSDQQIKKLLA